MEKSTHPPEVTNYGEYKKAEGYNLGYKKATYDFRKQHANHQQSIHLQFGDFFDWLDDIISENKKH